MNKPVTVDEQKLICRNEWFKDHTVKLIATLGDADRVIILEWAKLGTWNYGCRYIIHRRWLTVVGDIGEAVYEWSQNLDLDFLFGCDFHYFYGKCQASETGRKFEYWCNDEAQSELQKMKDNLIKQYLEGDELQKQARSTLDILEDIGDDRKEFDSAAQDIYDSTGDAEEAGCISSMGIIPHPRAVGHWVGLKMAIEQLKKVSDAEKAKSPATA